MKFTNFEMTTNKQVVLVTGGSGLIGQSIKQICESEKPENKEFIFVSSKDADLRDLNQTYALFEKYQPSYVIHLAANFGGIFKIMKNNAFIFQTNFLINYNVLKCCFDYKVIKCISALSTAIFPDNVEYPIDESLIHNGPANNNVWGYSYEKRFIDILNKAYNESGSSSLFTSFIPCNIYGPEDNFNLKDGNVIPCLLHKSLIAKNDGKQLEMFGTGKAKRQFIFSYDLARLILLVLCEYNQPTPIILANNEDDEITIYDAAETIRQEFQIEQNLKLDSSGGDGQIKKTANNKKMRELWPDFKFTSFKEGISITAKWLRDNYESCRK